AVLVVLRAPERGGYWNLVAGGVEPGETAAQAATRELVEETGLEARVVPLGLDLSYELPEGRVRLDAFLAEAPPGRDPTLDPEHVDYRWCSPEEASALLAYPEPREAVAAAVRAGARQ
ncbi:MAG: NUDIX domain-containing protein, partial [Thermoleophilia bacterium]|nr:NUDIX domain-containing protein [Thermoleophilia bacterium]